MGFNARFTSIAAGLLFSLVSQAGLSAEVGDRDPWEGFNRKIFVFNDTLDRYFLKPVAKGYRAVTPDPVETGVSNFFSNLLEVRNILNDVLQWKWLQASNDTGRLIVNSTAGVVGIFDVARHFGMPRSEGEDFGQTFAVWGAGEGAYLVLPFLGSSTVRDVFGYPLGAYVHPVSSIDHIRTRNVLMGADLLDTRAKLLDAEDLLSGDKYSFIRDAYLQRRTYLIQDGVVEDDFGGELDF
ncbi:VacJ family lipoprotein [Aestuariicella hydrocarbonica]|uniref:VacJ family lipoprotein n=1 Tax=Pseudomaricurvus hydrocarbonicus TaxID=1470433 RepID=A0A9E5JSG5_9GAMM|nr:VacJ family lipoprotein [Aestuariicella hydrocarbonica]NHO64723.1 VacJ family lipoprotein [Aestuariicella hydrocarbonica]